jgi:Calcineurin-like phosphoesterase
VLLPDGPRPLAEHLTRVVIGDVHGDHALLERLLRELDVLDESGRRTDGFFVLALGDVAHLGHQTRLADVKALSLARRACEVVLTGNHELFHAHGLEYGFFQGMHLELEPEVREALDELLSDHQMIAAWCIDGILITHAGIHPRYAIELPDDAYAAAAAINLRFKRHLADGNDDALFAAVGGVRGPESRPGGIFWADLSELESHAEELRWPQIVGHTPQAAGFEARRVADNLWVCDAGAALSGRLAALVRRPGRSDWEAVVVRRD